MSCSNTAFYYLLFPPHRTCLFYLSVFQNLGPEYSSPRLAGRKQHGEYFLSELRRAQPSLQKPSPVGRELPGPAMPWVSGLAHRCPPLVCDPVPRVLRVPLLDPTLSGPPSTLHFPAGAYLVASRFPAHCRRLSGLRGAPRGLRLHRACPGPGGLSRG